MLQADGDPAYFSYRPSSTDKNIRKGSAVNTSVIVRAASRFAAAFLLIPILALASGCYPSAFRPITVPLSTIRYDAPGGQHRQLIVYLPGNGDAASAFERHGLLKELRARGPAVDVVAVDAYLAYYAKGIIFTRLQEDVIDPAKAKGYKHIWLIGNSLGAYGSISYARQHPEEISGVVLLGPFLGDKKIIAEITEAGGLQKWDPGMVGNNSQEDWDKLLWLWLRSGLRQDGSPGRVENGEPGKGGMPKIYLGYGKYDRFSYGQKLLAEILPRERAVSISGGHDWATWRELWGILLDKMISENTGGQPLLSKDQEGCGCSAKVPTNPLALDLHPVFQ